MYKLLITPGSFPIVNCCVCNSTIELSTLPQNILQKVMRGRKVSCNVCDQKKAQTKKQRLLTVPLLYSFYQELGWKSMYHVQRSSG